MANHFLGLNRKKNGRCILQGYVVQIDFLTTYQDSDDNSSKWMHVETSV